MSKTGKAGTFHPLNPLPNPRPRPPINVVPNPKKPTLPIGVNPIRNPGLPIGVNPIRNPGLPIGVNPIRNPAPVIPLNPLPNPGSNGVSAATKTAIEATFNKVMRTGGPIQWKAEMPLGVQFTSVPLTNNTYPDAMNYTALIVTGPLTPNAPKGDPNKATQFYLEQSGGFAGITEYAGPFTIMRTAPGPVLPGPIGVNVVPNPNS